jgi:undecaprenyl-phosphate 4-deoxy-4-formamido-L-arabinose transferase
MGVENARKVSAFRALHTDLRQAFGSFRSPFVTLDVLLGWGTTRFSAVPVEHATRHSGVSNYTFRKLIHRRQHDDWLHDPSAAACQPAGFRVCPVWVCDSIYVVGRYLVQGGSVPADSGIHCAVFLWLFFIALSVNIWPACISA